MDIVDLYMNLIGVLTGIQWLCRDCMMKGGVSSGTSQKIYCFQVGSEKRCLGVWELDEGVRVPSTCSDLVSGYLTYGKKEGLLVDVRIHHTATLT